MLDLLAQVSSNASTQPAAPAFLQQLISAVPILIALGAVFFLFSNTKRKEEKNRKQMVDNLKRGDRIQTIGGLLGTIVNADADEITVKVDETTNTKVRFVRSAVHKVLTDEKKAEAK